MAADGHVGGRPFAVPDQRVMLDAARGLIGVGLALHWLRRRQKAPIAADWSTAPVHTLPSLEAAYQSGANLGIRLGAPSRTPAGYLQLIDLDIRRPECTDEAWSALLALWPEARCAPSVISGSGGESRHFYGVAEVPLSSRKLARSDGFELVYDPQKGREVKKRDWEIELFGTGKQAVLPPSIHPETGLPYVWEKHLDLDLLEMGVGPAIPATAVAAWTRGRDILDEDEDLMQAVRSRPMGLSEAEITATIADLPPEWVEDRDGWLNVGQALHHEYEGGAPGFERWCEWSKTSAKYDAKDQAAVWKSFKGARNPIRMASLIKAAGDHRLAEAHADLDDLLGGTGTSLALVNTQVQADDLDLAELLGTPTGPIAPGAVVSGPPAIDPEWRSYLQRTEDGALKPGLHNAELIIKSDPRTRGVIALNEFTQEIVQIRAPRVFKLERVSPKPVRQLDGSAWTLRDPINGQLWSTAHDIDVRLLLETPERQGGYGLRTSDRDLAGAIRRAAEANRIHPVRDYLNGLVWDGQNRVDRLFVDYVGAEDNAYHREAALMFAMGAITRIFEPGHKFDFVPILEGLQGVRKSTFIRVLARHWFCELEGDFHDTKGMVERMQGSWIVEMPELQGFSRSDVTTIKGFVSRQTDKVRLAYERRAAVFPRQCVFIGSTNDSEYLRDSTGGRRFWPVACNVTEIDTDALALNVDQIWAEAKAMFDAWRAAQPHGELPLYMTNPVAAAEAKRLQESRRSETVEDSLAGQIEAWLDAPIGSDLGLDDLPGDEPRYRNNVCLVEIWVEMLGKPSDSRTDRDIQMLGRAMRKVQGWESDGSRRSKAWGKQRTHRRIHPK